MTRDESQVEHLVVNTIQLLLNYCIIIICHDLKFIITVLPTCSF